MGETNLNKNRRLSWEKVLNGLIIFFFITGIFFIPLLLSPFGSFYSSFDILKMFILRLFGAIIFILTVLREIFFPSLVWKNFLFFLKKYWFFPLVFIIVLGLLLFFSSKPLVSFYGSYARQNGYLSYLSYFFWFILLSFNLYALRGKIVLYKAVEKMALFMLLSSSLVSLYAVLQYFGLDIFSWQDPAYLTRRAFSTLGQPNFLASFLLLTFPLPLYFFQRGKNIWLKMLALFSFFLSLAAIFASASRGGLLALFFGFFLLIAYRFFFSHLSKIKKIVIFISIFFFIFLSLFLVEKVLPGRISGMFDFSSGSSAARVNIYSSAVSLILEKPLWGYGQETLQNHFFSRYQADWGLHDDIGQVADRAHNLILDILLSGGIFSLLAHILLYAFFFVSAWKIIKRRDDKSALALSFAIGIASYLFSLLFSFSVPSTDFYFFLLFALLLALDFKTSTENNQTNLRPYRLRIALAILIAFIPSAFFIYGAVNYFLADYYFNSAINYFFQNKLPEAVVVLGYVDKTKTDLAHKSYYNYLSAQIIANNYPYHGEQATNFMLKERLESSLQFLPLKITDIFKRAEIEKSLGDYEAAASDLDIIYRAAPNWPNLHLAKASLSLSVGHYDDALKALDSAWNSLPDINHPAINEDHLQVARSYRAKVFYYRAKAYRGKNENSLALENYLSAYQEDPVDYMFLKEAADMEFITGDLDSALDLVLRGYKLSPDDFNWSLMAYYIYERQQDKEQAIVWLEKAKAAGYMPEDLPASNQ